LGPAAGPASLGGTASYSRLASDNGSASSSAGAEAGKGGAGPIPGLGVSGEDNGGSGTGTLLRFLKEINQTAVCFPSKFTVSRRWIAAMNYAKLMASARLDENQPRKVLQTTKLQDHSDRRRRNQPWEKVKSKRNYRINGGHMIWHSYGTRKKNNLEEEYEMRQFIVNIGEVRFFNYIRIFSESFFWLFEERKNKRGGAQGNAFAAIWH
jgi:hypothetical protein